MNGRRAAALAVLALSLVGCTTDGASIAMPLPAGGPGPTIVAKDIAFTPAALTVPAGVPLSIRLDNQDDGVPHNLALAGPGDAPLAKSAVIEGPGTTRLETGPLLPGPHRFICMVHPTMVVEVTAEG